MSGRPVALDLYCHAGGAARGYHAAGFDIVGVDIEPMPEYPYEFHQDDAVDFLRRHGHEFDLNHGSPPCYAYSNLNAYNHKEYPRLIAATRDAMIEAGRPWVIENVEPALSEMINPVTLCGTMFGLLMYRHRLFETSFPLVAPAHPRHEWLCTRNGYLPTPQRPFMSIHGGKHSRAWQRKAAETMETPWITTIQGVCQAIPPRYAQYVGEAMLTAHVDAPS